MNTKFVTLVLTALLTTAAGTALACEYKAGVDKFADYAKCRYGADAVVVVDLPKEGAYEQCVYMLQAFMPSKLLAVTRQKNGKEEASIFNREQIGNPCYLTKKACDAALAKYLDENP